MLTEALIPGTDDWYLVELGKELGANFPRIAMLESYRDGTFVVPVEADPAVREAYKKFARKARLTIADTIVTQVVGRQDLRGFRTAAENDANGDREAARLMRQNDLDVQFSEAFDKKAQHGVSFGVVAIDPVTGEPFGKILDSWSVAVRMSEIRPMQVDAAIIASWDPFNQQDVLTLLRPGYMRVAVKPGKQSTIPRDGTQWEPGLAWEWTGGPIPLGFTERVPVVRWSNPHGLGEYENHIDSIDRITEDILQRLTITAMQAFRQRAVTPGDGRALPSHYPDDHPESPGEPIDYDEIYKGGPAALWFLPEGAKIWESSPTDISSLINAEDKDIEHLAAVTGTPLFSVSPAENQSAEGAKLSRETIRTKVRDRNKRDGRSATEFMSLLFEANGDQQRADRTEIVSMWGPMEHISMAEAAEAARAARDGGMSLRGINEHIYQMTPDEMQQEEMSIRDEQFQNSLMGVTVDAGNGQNAGPPRAAETVADRAAPPAAARAVGELQPVE